MHVYKTVQNRSHHRAWKDGRVYEHIIIAEQELGRELKPREVVHHIDHDKLNNDPENLMVFRSENDHKAYHAGEKIAQHPDGTWSARWRYYMCKQCGKTFLLTSGRKIRNNMFCSKECSYKYRSKISADIHCIVQDLHDANGNFSEVGRKYGVTPNAIVKMCRENGFPYHSKDYKKRK